jgi:hypothetical protein
MRKTVTALSIFSVIMMSTAAMAGNSGQGQGQGNQGQGNSTSGGDRYDSNPGRQQATDVGAQCGSGAGSGAFGYFGVDNNLAGGADGYQTGLNNSSLCGNR